MSRPRHSRAGAFAAGFVAALGLAAGVAGADEIVVDVTAPPGSGPTAFVITCDGAVRRDVTPTRLTFPGPSLDCEIRAEGPLEVVGRAGASSVARLRTSGGTLRLRLR
jgi:hypothetical protein